MKNIDYKHIVQAEDIRPIRDHVLVSDMDFQAQTTKGGIILTDDDGSEGGIHPRWGKVYAIGDQQEDVKVGQWIMVSHGRWSRGFKIKKKDVELEVRMVDENDILLVSDDEPGQNRMQAGYVNTGGMQQMTKLPGND